MNCTTMDYAIFADYDKSSASDRTPRLTPKTAVSRLSDGLEGVDTANEQAVFLNALADAAPNGPGAPVSRCVAYASDQTADPQAIVRAVAARLIIGRG